MGAKVERHNRVTGSAVCVHHDAISAVQHALIRGPPVADDPGFHVRQPLAQGAIELLVGLAAIHMQADEGPLGALGVRLGRDDLFDELSAQLHTMSSNPAKSDRILLGRPISTHLGDAGSRRIAGR